MEPEDIVIMSEDKEITPLMPYKYIYALWDKHYDSFKSIFKIS